jgi:signal recognition particle receptor subunit beta
VPESALRGEPELDEPGVATIFRDYLAIGLGSIGGFDTTLWLYSVSGQDGRDDARRAVLAGADGVVFVADAEAGREAENVQSIEELREALAALRPGEPSPVPVVVQYNKLDLDQLDDPERLAAGLGAPELPVVHASALESRGVVETLETIAREVIRAI